MLRLWEGNQTSEAERGILQTDFALPEVESPLCLSVPTEKHDKGRSVSKSLERLDVGFTGTRRGMTDWQYHKVDQILGILADKYSATHELWAHHGDCTNPKEGELGADEQFHELAMKHLYLIHIHPPSNNKLRAHRDGDYREPPKSYKIRNADIVRDSALLIATPHRHEKDGSQIYSGTWATVRIARRRKKPYVVFHSDGRREGGNKWKKFLIKRDS